MCNIMAKIHVYGKFKNPKNNLQKPTLWYNQNSG